MITCRKCNGTGNDTLHNWKDGDIESSRIDQPAACEECYGYGEIDATLRELWRENDKRLNS